MSLKRTGSWLAAWVLVMLAASPGAAQPPEGQVIGDFQLFAPGEQASLGGGPRANQGLFFTYNQLFWDISAPKTSPFGFDFTSSETAYFGPVEVNPGGSESSTFSRFNMSQGTLMNTGFIKDDWSAGQEITGGFVREHEGIMFQYFRLRGSTQELTLPFVQSFFQDLGTGFASHGHLEAPFPTIEQPPPTPVVAQPPSFRRALVEYDAVTLRNFNEIWGVGLDYLYRQHPTMSGGMFEWIFGARYIDFHERFDADATGGVLGDTHFTTDARNRIVGPEIGLRWFRRSERWTWSAQGSFISGANFQSVRQDGELATALDNSTQLTFITGRPVSMRAMGFNYSSHMEEFSPVVDVKLELKWQATRALALNVGWNGMWIDNVARPSGMNDYTLYETRVMGIRDDRNKQDLFLTGIRFGLEFNR